MNKTKFFKKKTILSFDRIRLFFTVKIVFLIVPIFLIGCKKQNRSVSAAFYHWKTHFQPSDFEKNYCQKLHIPKVYVRLFDVDWKEASRIPYPLAVSDSLAHSSFEIVPTIFITNRTFVQMADYQIDTLAQLVLKKISSYTEGGQPFKEIQIDCDWTETSQKRFFNFLKALKRLSQMKISATIRLHQVKFKDKTGIPPVDEGVLMAYNMGNLDDVRTQNSILDIAVLKSYISNLKNYPLKLHIALPIFSWGVVLRDGEVVKLIHNLDKNTLVNNTLDTTVLKAKSDIKFEILKNTYLNGYYLYKDDEIRIENVPLSILEEAADILAQNSAERDLTVIFYHLDSVSLQRYRYEDLEHIIHRFQ